MQSTTTRLPAIQQIFAVQQRFEQSVNHSIQDWLNKPLIIHYYITFQDRVEHISGFEFSLPKQSPPQLSTNTLTGAA
jgi:hypothetical protein